MPGENPCSHKRNIQPPHRKAGLDLNPGLSYSVEVLNTGPQHVATSDLSEFIKKEATKY